MSRRDTININKHDLGDKRALRQLTFKSFFHFTLFLSLCYFFYLQEFCKPEPTQLATLITLTCFSASFLDACFQVSWHWTQVSQHYLFVYRVSVTIVALYPLW